MTDVEERHAAVSACLDRVRAAIREQGVTRSGLETVSGHLRELARRTELFPADAFPPPAGGERTAVYLLSEDPDHGNALYVVSEAQGNAAPPHDHKTWAVIAGIQGEEVNRIYERVDDGSEPGRGEVRQREEVVVKQGTAVAYLPEDIHSIHCFSEEPTVTLHLYGRAIDHQRDRIRFDPEEGTVAFFTPNEIRR